jgi:hypothetical protein
VSRLEDVVAFCAWSCRVRWKGGWVSVEAFLSQRYNLNTYHGIPDEAMRQVLIDAGLSIPGRLRGLDAGAAPS